MYNHTTYIGVLPREEKTGYGLMKFKDGTKMEGVWKKGNFTGRTQFPEEQKLEQEWSQPPNEVESDVVELWKA